MDPNVKSEYTPAAEAPEQPTTGANSTETEERIEVVIRDPKDNTVYFQVKTTTRFSKIFTAFFKSCGIPENSMQFTYNGNSVDPNSTVMDVQFSSGDIIDAHAFQSGGYRY
ncbi:hypothetical protein PCE1_003800 [Barthelona sp. PCE]